MAALYSNENFPLPVVEELRQLGHNVLTIQGAAQSGQSMSDEAVLEFARSQGRTLLTLNRKHFIRLHEQKRMHSGIIACTFDSDFHALAQRIDAAIQKDPHLAGRLVRINRPAR